MDFSQLWNGLLWPLLRLLCGLACGLLAANLLEALRWTQGLSRAALPLARAAHLGETAAASFPLAFLSAASSNALLGEACRKGRISRRELMLANLFNSLPAYLLHTPTIFLLTWPVLGRPAITYVGLTLCAAGLRTLLTLGVARCILPPGGDGKAHEDRSEAADGTGDRRGGAAPREPRASRQSARGEGGRWSAACRRAWQRFLRRLPRLVCITVPVYVLMFCLHRWGVFTAAQNWLAAHADWLAFLKPEAMGIIVLHLAAELGAALGAAGSALYSGGLSPQDAVLALLVGNILSTPMRALRHQLPAYAAYYPPRMALELILANQGLRACSLALMAALYWWLAC